MILITRRAPGSAPLRSEQVRRMASRMLTHLELADSELSILLVGDEEMREINREHREKDKSTDVLAFPQNEFIRAEEPEAGSNLALLGDIVISIDTAERQAKGRKRPLAREVCFLLAHGVLHLLGHDHAEPDEKKEMQKRTRELVRVVYPS